jgi:hypothetical protein
MSVDVAEQIEDLITYVEFTLHLVATEAKNPLTEQVSYHHI